MAFAPPGDLCVTERPGRIRVVHEGHLVPEPLATRHAAALGEGDLMGLAIDPAFATNGSLYVCYTRGTGGGVVNRLARLTVRNGKAGAERVLLDGIPAAQRRDGGLRRAVRGDEQSRRPPHA